MSYQVARGDMIFIKRLTSLIKGGLCFKKSLQMNTLLAVKVYIAGKGNDYICTYVCMYVRVSIQVLMLTVWTQWTVAVLWELGKARATTLPP